MRVCIVMVNTVDKVDRFRNIPSATPGEGGLLNPIQEPCSIGSLGIDVALNAAQTTKLQQARRYVARVILRPRSKP